MSSSLATHIQPGPSSFPFVSNYTTYEQNHHLLALQKLEPCFYLRTDPAPWPTTVTQTRPYLSSKPLVSSPSLRKGVKVLLGPGSRAHTASLVSTSAPPPLTFLTVPLPFNWNMPHPVIYTSHFLAGLLQGSAWICSYQRVPSWPTHDELEARSKAMWHTIYSFFVVGNHPLEHGLN